MSLIKTLLFILFSPIILPFYAILYLIIYCMPYSDPAKISKDFFLGEAHKKRIKFYHDMYWKGKKRGTSESSNCTTQGVDTKDQFLIVGSGFVGLSTAVTLKRYGIPFTIIDKNSEVGGNWSNGVYESVHIISSKKTTELKDFPMPEDYPDFPSSHQMLSYLKSYQRHAGIEPIFNCEAQNLEFLPEENQSWRVKLSTQEEPLQFKGVILCDGHHSIPRFPCFPDSKSKFTGKIIHSKEITDNDAQEFAGKRVCIIGGGNSSCDLAVLAARYAKLSVVSHRRGYYFLPRSLLGVPLVEVIRPWMPVFLQQILLHLILFVVTGQMQNYGLQKPDHAVFAEKHPTINSELLQFIKLGKIHPHSEIREFLGGNKILFKDGKTEEIDLIVCCTGYHNNHPLANRYLKYHERLPQVLGGVVVPSAIRRTTPEGKPWGFGEKNLYVQGTSQPRYGVGPLITFGSDILAQVLCLQESVPQNIGHVLDAFGAGGFPQRGAKTADILSDPHELWGRLLMARWCLPWLPSVYRLAKKWGFPKIQEHMKVPGEYTSQQWKSETRVDHIRGIKDE